MPTINNWNNSVTGAASVAVTTTTGPIVISSGTGSTTIGNLTGATTLKFGSGSALSAYIAKTSFTPILKFGTGTTGITYTTQTGYYTQIGSLVIFNINIVLSSKGSSTGTASITGLTLTTGNDLGIETRFNVVTYTGSTMSYYEGTAVFFDSHLVSGGRVAMTHTNFSNNSEILLSGSVVLN